MPTYQYSCTDCGHFLEIFQSFSDDSLTVCPQCEGRLRKVFNAVGVVFKGSGFYRNDSRQKSESTSEKTPEKTSEKTSANGSKKPSEKSSSTTATKSESSSGTSAPAASA